jgi:hypothetical protein
MLIARKNHPLADALYEAHHRHKDGRIIISRDDFMAAADLLSLENLCARAEIPWETSRAIINSYIDFDNPR